MGTFSRVVEIKGKTHHLMIGSDTYYSGIVNPETNEFLPYPELITRPIPLQEQRNKMAKWIRQLRNEK